VAPAEHRDVSKLADTLGLDHGMHRGGAGRRPPSSSHTSRNAGRPRRRENRRHSPTRG
jgi:hypothetical protein